MNYWIFMTFKIPSKTEILWFCDYYQPQKRKQEKSFKRVKEKPINLAIYKKFLGERQMGQANVGSIRN